MKFPPASEKLPTIAAASSRVAPEPPRSSPKTIAPRESSETRTPERRATGSASREQLGRSRHDLLMWDVTQVLIDIPAMPERVVDLPVPVSPEHVRQGLAYLRPCRDGLGVGRFCVGDFERKYN